MLDTNQNQFFEAALFESLGQETTIKQISLISGGNVNSAVKLVTNRGPYFIKFNESQPAEMFQTEARGLKALTRAEAIRVPEVLGTGQIAEKSYLLLEYIDWYMPQGNFWEQFGQQLAILHAHTQEKFGLDHDNYLANFTQKNTFSDNWPSFFIENRLRPQFGLAYYNGLTSDRYLKQLDQLLPKLESILPTEKPALLHGDLSNGNFICNSEQQPIAFDPAIYYGHREMELAFIRLFGRFEQSFFDGYHEVFPIEPGFEERMPLYNLYPLMVNENLFGQGYISMVEDTLQRFVGR